MGVIRFRAQLQQRGPAAAVVLDETQVAAGGSGAGDDPVGEDPLLTVHSSYRRLAWHIPLGISRRTGAAPKANSGQA